MLAVDDITLGIAPGEFLAIVGPSGSGKSTLLRLISGLLKPDSGSVTVDGLPPDSARAEHRLAMCFQEPALLPWRTVRRNVRLPWELGRGKGLADRSADLLRLVGLSQFEDRYPAELSGGMRQRVALARALNSQPTVLLMDEPFQALDELHRLHLNDELQRIWRETSISMVFVTHSVTEALYLADRVLVLTERPARTREIVDSPFPRPRSRALRRSLDFIRLSEQVLNLLDPPASGETPRHE
jgi:NitT/TauT family transport system ATP-binding protein